jgi:hypothetical protein
VPLGVRSLVDSHCLDPAISGALRPPASRQVSLAAIHIAHCRCLERSAIRWGAPKLARAVLDVPRVDSVLTVDGCSARQWPRPAAVVRAGLQGAFEADE